MSKAGFLHIALIKRENGRGMGGETAILAANPVNDIEIKEDAENIDGLNFLSGKTVNLMRKA